MKRLFYFIGFLSIAGLSSCKKFLDTKPTDFFAPAQYYNTEADLQTALNGVYDILSAYDEMYGQNYQVDITGGTDETFRNGTQSTGINVYLYDASYTTISNHWKTLYRAIELANNLLANIDKPVVAVKTNRDVIKGQALFLRAYYYFMLVNSFGDVPLVLTPTASVNNTNITRTPAKDVYTRIIDDMTEAEGLLQPQTSTLTGFGGKVSKTVVQGVLARVCLYNAGYPVRDQSKYAPALQWAQKAVASGEHSLNPSYQQVFINYAQDKYDVKESMWECEFWGNRQGNSFQDAGRIGNFSGPTCNDVSIGYSYGTLKATAKLYNLYNAADLRRDWNCCPYTWGATSSNSVKVPNTNIYTLDLGKFRREYETLLPKDKNYTSENFPLLRYADVLLMQAEAENEVNGPTATAYNAINQVRRRGFGKPVAAPDAIADLPAGLSKDQFRAALQDERARELAGEALRKADLIRWGIFIPTMKDFANFITVNAPAAQKYEAQAGNNVSARDLLLPIPLREITLNSSLIQNPGW